MRKHVHIEAQIPWFLGALHGQRFANALRLEAEVLYLLFTEGERERSNGELVPTSSKPPWPKDYAEAHRTLRNHDAPKRLCNTLSWIRPPLSPLDPSRRDVPLISGAAVLLRSEPPAGGGGGAGG